MTHTLHRRGSVESLSNDFLVQVVISRQAEGSKKSRNKSLSRSIKNASGKMMEKYFSRFPGQKAEIEKIILGLPSPPRFFKNFENKIIKYFVPSLRVYNTKSEFTNCLGQLKKIDLGSSVVVSGLFEEINECLNKIDIRPHTVQFSLGVFGRIERLPEEKILEITTMCGHQLLSPWLVKNLIKDVKDRRRTPQSAAELLNKQCICGAFNKARAAKLFEACLLDDRM
jgi:hypothetical protein